MISSLLEDPQKIREGWQRIFSEYGYMDKINKLSNVYPEEKSIYVAFKDISEFSRINGFDQGLAEKPELFFAQGEDVLRDIVHPERIQVTRINLRLTGLSDDTNFRKEIRQLRSPDIGKLLSITGIIRKNTEVLPRLQKAAFECMTCSEVTYVPQERGRLDEPQKCSKDLESGIDHSKTKFKLRPELSEFVDIQKVELQENPETLEGGTQPQRITVIMEDDIAGRLFPGDRVTVDGVLRAEQKRIGNMLLTEYDIFFYAIHYKKSKELEAINVSPEDELRIIELSKTPGIIDKLAASIAPTIYGMEMVKTTLVLQMFGGVRKVMKDGTSMRGDIHVLMVGDPGTAKSQLLKYMTEISPRGVFAFGRGSSAAGLTAAAVRDDFGEGRWTLEAGALVLADNGFAAIDELDKMDDKDTASMHEAMEQQTITISKAGIMATLKSRCSILGAANPKFGRYDQNRTIVDQIDFPPPLLSRFDVIFKIIDKPDRNNDERLAEHVLKAHRVGEIYRSLELNEIVGFDIPEEEGFTPPIEKDIIRKYVSYSRAKIFPRLSDDAIYLLKDEYVKTRSSNADSIPITARQLESTIRLAEAAAKARLSPIVTAEDAMLAKKIVDYYLKDVSMTNGEVDIDILYSGTSSKQRSDLEMVFDIIKDFKKDHHQAEVDDVVALSVSRGMTVERAMDAITKLKSAGQIYEPSYKKLDVIK
ncbi:MAG: minichromosome maintenance protein MCM [Candidatus Thermoplasmatota archaeon]|nr:minichromosome maintenance protein MCM [Candidatus Thermoplasmatota archaeon]MCL6091163.1 minichromosome maintenance protein MCM [Candidatus Thermoplasmatota archaeon]